MKKILTSIFTLFLLSNILLAQMPTNGLIVYMPFNGNANDASGNNNNGVVYGATLTSDRFGNANSAYNFDGIKNYIQIPNFSSTNFNSDFTISVWVNINNYNNLYPQIIWEDSNAVTLGLTGSAYPPATINKVYFYTTYTLSNMQQPSTELLPTPTQVQTGVFHNIIIAKQDTTITYYMDGLTLLKQKYANHPLIAGHFLDIGRGFTKQDTTIYSFSGTIDDIRIYNRALSTSEINYLYNENTCYKQISVTDTLIINTITTALTTGQQSLETIKVYPNPTKDVLNIATSNTSTSYSISIINNVGQSVYSSQLNTPLLQVNLSSLGSTGLYIINILDNQSNVLQTKKLILE